VTAGSAGPGGSAPQIMLLALQDDKFHNWGD
jgi:hypothetical protein